MNYEQRLLRAIQTTSNNFKEALAQSKVASNCDLSLHDCRVIEFISNNSYTLNELAHQFQVTAGTMSGHVERLVSQGILERTRDNQDRRKTYLTLSQKGLEYHNVLHEKVQEFAKKTLETIPKEKQEEMISLFEKMAQIDLK